MKNIDYNLILFKYGIENTTMRIVELCILHIIISIYKR